MLIGGIVQLESSAQARPPRNLLHNPFLSPATPPFFPFKQIIPTANMSYNPLEWLFGRAKTPAEMLRQHQRALNRAIRDLDRERAKMEAQEKKLINDIKTAAKKNQMVGSNGNLDVEWQDGMELAEPWNSLSPRLLWN